MPKTYKQLKEDKIFVTKSKDIGRLHDKSHFGALNKNHKLLLNFLEGVFLVEEGKIIIFYKNKKIDIKKLITIAAKKIPAFEIKFLIFRDLRKRGYSVKIEKEDKVFDFYIDKQKKSGTIPSNKCFISSYTERDAISIYKTRSVIQTAICRHSDLWYVIVDEEGDLTYYDVGLEELKGDIGEHFFNKATGYFLENRVVIFNENRAKRLFEKEFFGKPLGKGLQLSLVEALYLMERNIIDMKNIETGRSISKKTFKKRIKQLQSDIDERSKVFKDLKQRGLIVKTGFKFGAHFRAYTKNPDEIHAEYLIHVVNKGFESIWAEISRAVRLAHSVNKEIVFALVDEERIDYIKFGRLRP